MPSVTLLPGAVTIAEDPDNYSVTVAPMVVGDPPQWADGSDSTWGVSYRAAAGEFGWTWAPVDVFGGSPDGVTAVGITVRALYDCSGTADTTSVEVRTPGGGNGIGGSFAIPNDAAIHDLSYTFTDADYAIYAGAGGANSPAAMAAILASGNGLIDFIPDPTGSLTTLTVYECAVVVTSARKPHCRTFPRDDRRGPSPRIHPPPRAAQTPGRITGYQ